MRIIEDIEHLAEYLVQAGHGGDAITTNSGGRRWRIKCGMKHGGRTARQRCEDWSEPASAA